MFKMKKMVLPIFLSLLLTIGIMFWSADHWSEYYFDGVPLLICHILHLNSFPFLVGTYLCVTTLYVFLFFWVKKFGKMKYLFWGALIAGYLILNIVAGRFIHFDIPLESIIGSR